jgi:hypothetical protein
MIETRKDWRRVYEANDAQVIAQWAQQWSDVEVLTLK